VSWLYAAAGAGSLLGSVATAAVGGTARRGRALAVTAVVFSAMVIIFAIQRELVGALVAVAALSLAAQVQIGLHIALYQQAAPEHVRGRVTAVSATLVNSSIALGALAFGALGSFVRIDLALLAGGVIALVLVAGMVRAASLRAVDLELSPEADRV
jgi:ENTS family enterobactin (siderophore) exporter